MEEDVRPELSEGLPVIGSPTLRRKLYIVELERLLGEPVGFSIRDDFDPLFVRVSKAVETIEQRCAALQHEAQTHAGAGRIGVALSAVIGVAAILTGIAVKEFAVPAFVIAGLEIAAVYWFSRRSQRFAADAAEIEHLGGRYRGLLDACKTPEELQKLSNRILREMQALWST